MIIPTLGAMAYSLLVLFMIGAICINPRDPIDPPAIAE